MPSLNFGEEKERFINYYSANYELLKQAEDSFRSLISTLISNTSEFEKPTVTSRLKDRDGCIEKFSYRYQSDLEKEKTHYEIKDHITDLIGVRVVCLYESDIPHIAETVNGHFEVLEVTDKIKKMEETESSFGYKGLHLDIKIDNSRLKLPEWTCYREIQVELQIRTIIQDAWSNLDHKIKYKKSIPLPLKRRVNVLAALFELADHEFLNIKKSTRSMEEQAKMDTIHSSGDAGPSAKDIIDLYLSFPLSSEEKRFNVFDFLNIANKYFEEYNFYNYKADGFVQELLGYDPSLNPEQFNKAMENHLLCVNNYADYQKSNYNRLNPFTKVRHVMYLYDKDKYEYILYDNQRNNFDKWLSENSS